MEVGSKGWEECTIGQGEVVDMGAGSQDPGLNAPA